MIQIVKLSLKNFKSFKKADIPIADGFTVIAGSNGSGKSNILDSLMFSLGMTSLKALRASRLTDLVNATAEENYAKVDLFLKDETRNYTVSRMIDRQGKGVYRLNDERKTLNETASLLNELGISPNGHNIVVQGDITRVIEMSPEERRGIVDEVAGIREFDEKKSEALKELQRVDEKIKDVRIVLNERDAYLKELEREREAALEFEALEDERKRTHATLLFLEMANADAKAQKLRERKAALTGERQAWNTETERLRLVLVELKTESARLNAELISHSEKTFGQTGARLEAQKSEQRVLAERLSGLEQARTRHAQEITGHEKRIEELHQLIRTRETEVRRSVEALPELDRDMQRLGAEKEKGLEQKNEIEQSQLAENEENARKARQNHQSNRENRLALEGQKRMLENQRTHWLETRKALELEMAQLEKKMEQKNSQRQSLLDIQKQFPDVAKAVTEAEKTWAHELESQKELEAQIQMHREYADQLGSAKGICPVCEKPLPTELKKSLAAQKNSHLAGLEKERDARTAQCKKAHEVLLARRQAADQVLALSNELADLGEWEKRAESTRKRIDALELAGVEKQILSVAQQISDLALKEEKSSNELDGMEAKTSAAKTGQSMNQLIDINNRLVEAQRLHSRLESLVQNWNTGEKASLLARIQEAESTIADRRGGIAKWQKETAELEDQRRKLDSVLKELETEMKKADLEREKIGKEREKAEQALVKTDEKLDALLGKIKSNERQENDLNIDLAKHEVRLTDLRTEFEPLKDHPRIANAEPDQLHKRLPEIEKRLRELGAINQRAIESYNQLHNEMDEISGKLSKLETERLAVLDMAEKIEVQRREVFMGCFEKVQGHFKRLFQTLFSGVGELRLSNPADPLNSGLLIEAKHKGDRIVSMDSMSGGEKTLTALAFLFGIQFFNPAPFYVFDEADAALDKENSAKLARLIKEISTQSQFIAITHNDNLINEADQIIGVALDKTKSSVLTLRVPRNRSPPNPLAP